MIILTIFRLLMNLDQQVLLILQKFSIFMNSISEQTELSQMPLYIFFRKK
jgi:hypothetical protein